MATGITLDEFLRMEDDKPALEYACGEVMQKPQPDWNHATLQAYLMAMLYEFLTQTRLGRAVPELRCIFGPPGRERVFVPDLVYVAKEQLPVDRFLRVAPYVAIEILSPDQHMARFMGKVQFYLRYGVRMVWVIDPIARTILVLTPDQDEVVLTDGDTLEGGDVLPGFTVAVDDIFAQMDQ